MAKKYRIHMSVEEREHLQNIIKGDNEQATAGANPSGG
jgi:hypothetical protein